MIEQNLETNTAQKLIHMNFAKENYTLLKHKLAEWNFINGGYSAL